MMKITEIHARSILTKTNIPGMDYCLNPYVGCAHGCRYCYATFMRKYTGHEDTWGSFVDAKVNAANLLKKVLRRGRRGKVVVSSVTDPYQPVERIFKLTRACLDLLTQSELSVSVLTKSGLVVRDMDLFNRAGNVDVGLTITTNRERMRRVFEPGASTIRTRIEALRKLHEAGICTYVFIGPILPMDPEKLVERIAPHADKVLIDRMNYAWKVRRIFEAHDMEFALEDDFFEEMETRLAGRLSRLGIETQVV